MVHNLLKAGYEVIVYDLIQDNIDKAVADGATAAQSNKVAELCDGIMITMLPNSPHVKTAVLGENGLLQGAKPGYVLIDMSSIAPKALGYMLRVWQRASTCLTHLSLVVSQRQLTERCQLWLAVKRLYTKSTTMF